MDVFRLESAWLFKNREAFPWSALTGAQIFTSDGQCLTITHIQERSWPTGPLITVAAQTGSTQRNGLYNIQAFNDGPFKSLIPTHEHAGRFLSLFDATEGQRVATEKAEIERLAAQQRARDDIALRKTRELAARREAHEDAASQQALTGRELNEARKFDLLIFDLDDTLLSTEHLEVFRGKASTGAQNAQYVSTLREQAKSLVHLIPEILLLGLQSDFPDLKLSIFTRSPRAYALTLLESRYPKVQWDSVIAFEDVASTKPHPEGVYLAAQNAKVKDKRRIALIGDGKNDVVAAYQAGVQAILFTPGWGAEWSRQGGPNRTDHYKTIEFMPDAKITAPQDIRRLVTDPIAFLPCLEAWDADPSLSQVPAAMRIDVRKHFNPLDDAGYPYWVETHALGRYFASANSSSQHDFAKREQHHLATKSILDAKDGIAYPQAWAECCANYISGHARELHRTGHALIVCPIPSSSGSIRPQGRDRLIDLFKAISAELKARPDAALQCDVLDYAPGASSNKKLDREARFANVRDHLVVSNAQAVKGKAVLVIDDVATSGATFFYAERYLMEAGARSVRCLALTQTIS